MEGGISEGTSSENLNSFLVLLSLHRALLFLYRNERPMRNLHSITDLVAAFSELNFEHADMAAAVV